MPAKKDTRKKENKKEKGGELPPIPVPADVALVATLAASLMPRMTIQPAKSLPNPKVLRLQLEGERGEYTSGIREDDGTTILDVVMEEAICRARLLLNRVAGGESPTRIDLANYVEGLSPMLAAVKRVKSAVRGRTEPIPWREFAAWVLDGSKDEMWEKCWKGYQAGLIEDSYRAQYDEEYLVVWETDATAKDRKNPNVVIRPDSEMDRIVPSEQAAAQAMGLYRFYESNKDRFRQALKRKKDRTRNGSANTRRTAQLPETFVEHRRKK